MSSGRTSKARGKFRSLDGRVDSDERRPDSSRLPGAVFCLQDLH